MIPSPEQTNALIRARRSVFPNMYTDTPIPRAVLEEILENANWAPTHRLTEPWRFKVFTGDARERLSAYLADYYRAHTPEDLFSEKKLEKTRKNPLRAAAVVAICMRRDPETRVPEWEELAAVSAAVQNMWLSCTAYGIGSYWSSPKSILEADTFLGLQEGERCLGLFYMGYYEGPELPGKRDPMQDKVEWLQE